MPASTTSLLDPSAALRRLRSDEAPYPGMLHAGDPQVVWVDVDALPEALWRCAVGGHVLVPQDVERTPDGHAAVMVHCPRRLAASVRDDCRPGEMVTIAVSMLRAAEEVRRVGLSSGEWWVDAVGRPVLAATGDRGWAGEGASLLAELAACADDASEHALAEALRDAAGLIERPRLHAADVAACEEALFAVSDPEPLATMEPVERGPVAPRRADTVRYADDDGAASDRFAPWVDAGMAERIGEAVRSLAGFVARARERAGTGRAAEVLPHRGTGAAASRKAAAAGEGRGAGRVGGRRDRGNRLRGREDGAPRSRGRAASPRRGRDERGEREGGRAAWESRRDARRSSLERSAQWRERAREAERTATRRRDTGDPPRRRRAPWLIAAVVGAAVLAGGLLWPEPESRAAEGKPSPAASSSADEPTPGGDGGSGAQTPAVASADPAAPSDAPPVGGAVVGTDELESAARQVLAALAVCAAQAVPDCAALRENHSAEAPDGLVAAADGGRVTLVDEYGGVAVFRVEPAAGAGSSSQILVLVAVDGKWLIRDVYDVADQP